MAERPMWRCRTTRLLWSSSRPGTKRGRGLGLPPPTTTTRDQAGHRPRAPSARRPVPFRLDMGGWPSPFWRANAGRDGPRAPRCARSCGLPPVQSPPGRSIGSRAPPCVSGATAPERSKQQRRRLLFREQLRSRSTINC
ncbi:hypothetical protein SORBI_3007G193600 [Sorghum bicolor]|uniref:Uncharacterized protein n=1 Tax=Sorghum bicolor TaxID=4558 RepID=A0A1B6PIV7_SORBI|nr:hypothetical protein SORBI_3007G193600 [Sorghum bicolor]